MNGRDLSLNKKSRS